MTCFKSFALAFALLLPPLFSGCGYRIGARSLVHPQIKSIAVGEIKNDTLEPLAGSIMRQQLCERYMFDGALKLKNKGDADCILYGTIRSVKNTTIREDDNDNDIYRPAEFRLEVELEYSVVIPGRGQQLFPTRTVLGGANYQILADPMISRQNALKQACYNTAKLAVEYTTEAW